MRRSVFLLAVGLAFAPEAWADESTDDLGKSLDLVQKANAMTDAKRVDLLEQAITQAQAAPNHRLKGHRVQAIGDIRAAMAQIRQGDPNHCAGTYLQDAEKELGASISLASGAGVPASSPAPVNSTPADAAHVTTYTTVPTVQANYLPPGVTAGMEQALIAKYSAASKKQDADAFMALIAWDPAMDPKAKEGVKDMFTMGFLLDSTSLDRTYTFLPVSDKPAEKPTPVYGKLYTDSPAPVAELQITYAKKEAKPGEIVPGGPTTLPVCVRDGQLMFCGLKAIPGAVPPPAMGKTENFGVQPALGKEGEDSFDSLAKFLASLKQQPAVTVLDSGDAKFEYYAICRIAPNLCVFAGGNKPGRPDFSFFLEAADSNKQPLKGAPKWIRLVDQPTMNGQAPVVQGTVFFVPDHYNGPVTITAHYTDDAGKETDFTRTIDWKSEPGA